MGSAGQPVTVVTGANSGVGYEATLRLAGGGHRVVMVCRDAERGGNALAAIRAAHPGADLSLELADLSSIAQAKELALRLRELDRIDLLVNNAGVARMELEITDEGFERTMATNHLGHFVLTLGVIDRVSDGGGRVINVSSEGHRRGDLRRIGLEEILRGRIDDYNGFQAYCDSKLANVLFSNELARRYGRDGLTAVALHPGVLSTRIWNKDSSFGLWVARLLKPFMGKPAIGGDAVYRLAADPDVATSSGVYFKVREQLPPAHQAEDRELAGELWNLSERLTG